MKITYHLPVMLMATAIVGTTAAPVTRAAWAASKKAPCAVCSVREGAGPEAVKATATYEGKQYSFCTEKCRTEFLKDPKAFLNANTPRPAPAFSLKELSGKNVSLADYQGKVVLLDFWATFCGPCVEEMPKLQKLHEKYGAQGFSVIGIATDEEGAKVVAPAAARIKVKYPVLISDTKAWENYGVETLPALFLIDRKGQIVQRFGGKTEHKVIAEAVRKLVTE